MGKLLGGLLSAGLWLYAGEPPTDWVDPATGHRVVRLSQEPGTSSLYFHQNAFTKSGDKMVFSGRKGVSVVDMKTRKVDQLVQNHVVHVIVAKNRREAFYLDNGAVVAVNLDTRAKRTVAKIPADWSWGSGFSINSDETILAGSYTEGGRKFEETMPRSQWFQKIFEGHLPSLLYTINVNSGAINVFHRGRDWFNHVQYSPSEPTLLMFCHEGPWEKVDRIWTIRTDGTQLKKLQGHSDQTIAGHEFWDPNGRTVWFKELNRAEQRFWLGGMRADASRSWRIPIEPDQWSGRFNIAPDGKMFAGSGTGADSSAEKTSNARWIFLYRRKDRGVVEAERLVNMARHDYKLEPNVAFTPDGKWVVFRSNMHGATYIYAVEVAKSGASKPNLGAVR